MAELPSGTVTFLLTDVEGSTALWEQAPEAMRTALARHDALFDVAVSEHGGLHIRPRGEGDSRFAVFASALEAVTAAVAIQRAFAAEPWTTPRPISVRIGVHTGEAQLRDGDYYGAAVNRCARLRGIGHGGQILLSEATATLARDDLPASTSLVEIGTHRLKDLTRPEQVFQLVIPGLPSDFPPLSSLRTGLHNLPVQPTVLLGREREVGEVRALLARDDVRLVTLTGPGGTGKTRLSLQVAAEVVDSYDDGAFIVELASIVDATLVPSAIAQVLGVRDVGGHPLLERLKDHLRSRTLLLVLDNFEQVLPAAPVVADLLATSPGLKMLLTSREPLRLRGEREYAVPPLALPDTHHLPEAAALSRYAAVALFIERSVAIRADFAVTNENGSTVAEICRRLDGLPLAIELAAARIRLLPPQAMLARLERRLPLLTGGARDLPARQQTLRGAIAWSYDLLDEAERALFRRLSIFVGGWTLEAAETVSNSEELGVDVLEGVASLVAKSLVRQETGLEGEPRFGMLETIREYGLEQLEASGEVDATRRQYVAFFMSLAEQAEPMLLGREQLTWLRRLDLEHGNVRAILAWSRDQHIPDDVGLRLAGALPWYWYFRNHLGEGRGWVEPMLVSSVAAARTGARARVLYAAARFANHQADYQRVQVLAHESATIFREVGDLQGAGRSLAVLGVAAGTEGQIAAGRSALEESVMIARAVGDRWGVAYALGQLAGVAHYEGDIRAARALREQSASLAREIGERYTLGVALAGQALLTRLQGDPDESTVLFQEALLVSSQLEDPVIVPRALAGLASAARSAADYDKAARLFGTVEALREASGTRELPAWRVIFDQDILEVRAALGDESFAAAWAEGRGMTLEQAVTYALVGLTSS
jgi:predicted ATPase/class 3 adenylate cyclase